MNRQLIAILPLVGIGLTLCAFTGRPRDLHLSDYASAYTAISMYVADADDLYPRALFELNGTHSVFPYPVETASGWWATLERQEGARSLWANAIVPYAENESYLEIPGAADYTRPGSTIDPTKPSRKAGMTFNGLLQSLSTSSVTHKALVPLLWPGYGIGNVINFAGVNPSLTCPGGAIGECVYQPSSTAPGSAASMKLIRGQVYSAFPGLSVAEGDTDFSHFLMADGSMKRVRIGFNTLPGDATATGIHTVFTPEKASWTDGNGFAWHFRPDRSEDDFGSSD